MKREKVVSVILLIPLVLLLSAMNSVQADIVLYVDDDGPSDGDGRSWHTAYRYLQDALVRAKNLIDGDVTGPDGSGRGGGDVRLVLNAESTLPGDPCDIVIRVAQGVYKPDQGGNQKPGNRLASFILILNDFSVN